MLAEDAEGEASPAGGAGGLSLAEGEIRMRRARIAAVLNGHWRETKLTSTALFLAAVAAHRAAQTRAGASAKAEVRYRSEQESPRLSQYGPIFAVTDDAAWEAWSDYLDPPVPGRGEAAAAEARQRRESSVAWQLEDGTWVCDEVAFGRELGLGPMGTRLRYALAEAAFRAEEGADGGGGLELICDGSRLGDMTGAAPGQFHARLFWTAVILWHAAGTTGVKPWDDALAAMQRRSGGAVAEGGPAREVTSAFPRESGAGDQGTRGPHRRLGAPHQLSRGMVVRAQQIEQMDILRQREVALLSQQLALQKQLSARLQRPSGPAPAAHVEPSQVDRKRKRATGRVLLDDDQQADDDADGFGGTGMFKVIDNPLFGRAPSDDDADGTPRIKYRSQKAAKLKYD